jgi:thioredoxin-like negative regulator of GroEL
VLSRARELNVKVVVKFGAEWCKPCKRIAPAYESMAAAYAGSCIFCVVDVDEVEDLALEYGASMLPTFQVCGGLLRAGSGDIMSARSMAQSR